MCCAMIHTIPHEMDDIEVTITKPLVASTPAQEYTRKNAS